jgi:hypothetical protein
MTVTRAGIGWHTTRRPRSDLERWHRATERLGSMCVESPADHDAAAATAWCKVMRDGDVRSPAVLLPSPSVASPDLGVGESSYDQRREPTPNS